MPSEAANPAARSAAPDSAHALQRSLLALAVAAMGAVDVFSAALSHPPERLRALRNLLPTDVLDSSRTFTLLAGALLLVTAWGLRRGKRRAYASALFLCALSVPVNLLKAFDFEEATVASALMFALGMSADAFRVKSRALSLATLRSRALWAVVALALYAVLGSWIVQASLGTHPTFRAAASEALARALGIGDAPVPPAHLPHHAARIAVWFANSLPLLSLTALASLAIAALRPASHRGRHRSEAHRVEALLRAYGDSSVGWFALADDTDYFFSATGRAVIPYRFESDTLLGIGDPIGPDEELGPLLEAFERYCRERDWAFAFFQARPERLALYAARGWRALHVGEDPVLDPAAFTLEGGAVANVRRSARKAETAGVVVRHFRADAAAWDPATLPAGWTEQMRAVADEWLRAHHGGEKGFCMGRFDPRRLGEAWLAVAVHEASGRIEAFATWVPIPARRGWAFDLTRRRDDAIPGVMELLVTSSVAEARARGDAVLSLSLSALASVASAPGEPDESPEARRARAFLTEHLARFYDFKGLFQWKKKFDPRFEDRYLVYPSPFALPRVALALIRAQSPGGLASYFRRENEARPADGAPPATVSPA